MISLVTTVFNREEYLADCINSVICQSYPDWELIIWDDGSTDNSAKIAQEYAAVDTRITFHQGKHLGQTAALKLAMEMCSFPYFGWVDSDDLLHPTTLAETKAVLENHPEVGMVYTNYEHVNADGSYPRIIGSRCIIPYSRERLLESFITFHFRLIQKSIYDAVGGIDLEVPYVQDYDLSLKISEVTEIYHLQKILYDYRVHPNMVSKTKQAEVEKFANLAIQRAKVRRSQQQGQ